MKCSSATAHRAWWDLSSTRSAGGYHPSRSRDSVFKAAISRSALDQSKAVIYHYHFRRVAKNLSLGFVKDYHQKLRVVLQRHISNIVIISNTK